MILRQLQGKLTAKETEELRQWYDSSEQNRKAYADYCVLLRAQQTEHDRRLFTDFEDEAWHRVSRRMHPARLTPAARRWAGLAAAAVAALVVGFTAGHRLTTAGFKANETVVEVPDGAKTRIVLPDGTAVWLNAHSRMSYSAAFGKTDRNVTLDGEAYFDVTKNKSLPFEVQAAGTHVRVLGTRFDMKAYSTDERSRVTLLEGSLQVSADSENSPATTIKPGEQAVITRGSRSVSVRRVKASDYALWTTPATESPQQSAQPSDRRIAGLREPVQSVRRTLLFDEESLTQIAADLERAFNVDIKIEGNAGRGVYYGDFRNGETLFQILDAITSEGNISYEVKDNKIIIR